MSFVQCNLCKFFFFLHGAFSYPATQSNLPLLRDKVTLMKGTVGSQNNATYRRVQKSQGPLLCPILICRLYSVAHRDNQCQRIWCKVLGNFCKIETDIFGRVCLIWQLFGRYFVSRGKLCRSFGTVIDCILEEKTGIFSHYIVQIAGRLWNGCLT